RAGERLAMQTIVDDIKGLCAFRSVDRVTILGQSMGGTIALKLAHDAPEMVATLVLLASPGRDPGLSFKLQPASKWAWDALIGLNRMAPAALPIAGKALLPYTKVRPLMAIVTEVIRQEGFNPELARTDDIEEYIGKVLEISPRLFFD